MWDESGSYEIHDLLFVNSYVKYNVHSRLIYSSSINGPCFLKLYPDPLYACFDTFT